MSDFNYDLRFNIEGQAQLERAIRYLRGVGIEVDKLQKTYRRTLDSAGARIVREINSVTLKGLTRAQRDAARTALGADNHNVAAALGMRDSQNFRDEHAYYKALQADYKERSKLEDAFYKEQDRLAKQAEKDEIAKNKFLYDAMQADYKEKSALADKWSAEQERRIKDEEAIKSKQQIREADLSHRVADINDKIALARVAATTKSAAQQSQINHNLNQANTAYQKFHASHKQYLAALHAGNTTQMAIHQKAANRYLANAQAMVNAAHKLATANQKVASATQKVAQANQNVAHHAHNAANKQGGLFKTVNRMHGQLLSLNRLGHLAALGTGFYIAQDAARGYVNMVRESLKYNDELERAEVTFRSLAIANTGKSAEQIKRDNIPKEIEQLKQADVVAKSLSKTVREAATYAGQDFGEAIGAVKVTLGDIMSKYKGKNMLLDKPDEVKEFSKDLVEIASVMKMLDPQQRKLSFHAVALGEALSGTQEGSKALNANFISLLRRENVSLAMQTKKAVNEAINKGDFIGAKNALLSGLSKSGIYQGVLEDMKVNSIGSNMDGILANIKYMFGLFNKPMAIMLAEWTKKLNDWTRTLTDNKGFKNWLHSMGVEQGKFAERFVNMFIKIGAYFESDKGKLYFENMKKIMGGVLEVGVSIGKVIGSFLGGFLGINQEAGESTKNAENWETALKGVRTTIDGLTGPAGVFGVKLNEIANHLGSIVSFLAELENKTKILQMIFDGWSKIATIPGAPQMLKDFAEVVRAEAKASDMAERAKNYRGAIVQRDVTRANPIAKKYSDAFEEKLIKHLEKTTGTSNMPTITLKDVTIVTPDPVKFPETLRDFVNGHPQIKPGPFAGYQP